MARPRKKGKRTPSGQLSRAGQTKETKARETILQIQGDNLRARCRAMGINNPTEDQLIAARSPMTGCNAGRYLVNHAEKDDLWNAVCHIRKAYTAFARATGLPSRHAKCLSILTPPDTLEATAETPPTDLRDEEEKARAARATWMTVESWLHRLPSRVMSECKAVVLDDTAVRDGAGLEAALRVVSQGLKGAYRRAA